MHAGSVRMSKRGKRGGGQESGWCNIHFFFSFVFFKVLSFHTYKKLLLLEAVLGTVIR